MQLDSMQRHNVNQERIWCAVNALGFHDLIVSEFGINQNDTTTCYHIFYRNLKIHLLKYNRNMKSYPAFLIQRFLHVSPLRLPPYLRKFYCSTLGDLISDRLIKLNFEILGCRLLLLGSGAFSSGCTPCSACGSHYHALCLLKDNLI